MSARATSSTNDASADELLVIGRVWRAHGVQGEAKVIPETDDPARFETLERLYIGGQAETATAYAVEAVRYQQTKRGRVVLLKLVDVQTPEAVEALRQSLVFAAEGDLPPLEEDEFFLHDLVGLAVVTEEGEAVGTVRDVMEMPGHPLFVVEREGQPDAMIPAVAEFVTDVDAEAGRVTIRPIEGLLE